MSHIRLAERRGILQGHHLSRVQTLALEILMLWEDVREQRQERYQFRLGLLGQDPEDVRSMFPEFLRPTTVTDESDEDDIEQAIEREMAGESSEWVSTETPSPEEVTALLRQLTSGQGTMQDMTTEEGWE